MNSLDLDISRVAAIDESAMTRPQEHETGLSGRGEERARRNHRTRYAVEYFRTIAMAVEEVNDRLRKRPSGARYCVYRKKGRIFLDVVLLDNSGSIKELVTRDITDEEFTRIIDQASTAEGLLVDVNI